MSYASIQQYENEHGQIYLAHSQRKKDKWTQQAFNCDDLEKATLFLDEHNNNQTNLFYSTCAYKLGIKSKTNTMISSVRELYADIDNEQHMILNVKSAIEIIEDLEPYFDVDIPKPTRITYTGHGIHIKWKVVGELKENTVLCKLVMEALQNKVDELLLNTDFWLNSGYKVDEQANDLGRMLRLENSYNAKDPLVEIKTKDIYQRESELCKEDIFNFDLKVEGLTLKEAYNIKIQKKDYKKAFSLKELEEIDQEPQEQPSTTIKEWNLKTAYIWLKTNRKRLDDLETIQKLRNYANYNTGYRNTFIREYATILKCVENDKRQFILTLLNVNDWFNEPLGQKEVISWAKTIWNNGHRARQHKNKTLIKVLDITKAEREKLATIITKQEYLKKYYLVNSETLKIKAKANRKQAYKSTKEQNQRARERRNKQIYKLNAQGLSTREIAKKVNCSNATVSRVLRAL